MSKQIQLMAHQVLKGILDNVRSSKWYSIMAEETCDISSKEQLSLSLRWVESDYTIHEDFIGLVEVESTSAATLFSVLKDCLVRLSLPVSFLCGQAYDGGADMLGYLTGVVKRFENECPKALTVHCMAHCLNLCL